MILPTIAIIWLGSFLLWMGITSYVSYHGVGETEFGDVGSAIVMGLLFPPVFLALGLIHLPYWQRQIRANREAAMDADYQEVLQLIDWKPRERRLIDDLKEELGAK